MINNFNVLNEIYIFVSQVSKLLTLVTIRYEYNKSDRLKSKSLSSGQMNSCNLKYGSDLSQFKQVYKSLISLKSIFINKSKKIGRKQGPLQLKLYNIMQNIYRYYCFKNTYIRKSNHCLNSSILLYMKVNLNTYRKNYMFFSVKITVTYLKKQKFKKLFDFSMLFY